MRYLRPLPTSLALFVVAVATTVACSSAPSDGGQSSAAALSQSQCAAAKAWAPNTAFKVGDVVSFEGEIFVVIQAHTSQSDWPPNIVPALYEPTNCTSTAAPAPTTTTAPAPTTAPPAKSSPPAATATSTPSTPPPTSSNGTCVGGPKFDPAGAKNVGNGKGEQFIGGQCLSTADCASGCCAFPCGICSGPGAQFQAGKEGCGF